MKKTILGFALVSAFGVNALAGVVVCEGDKHTVVADSDAQTVLLAPEMTVAVAGLVGNGPEENTFVATDSLPESNKIGSFFVFMGARNGQMKANLFIGQNGEPEALTCTGSF
ncbi:hypothetical protein [Bdellovibrio sp. KM01]|uniref:hypothetical protein n=1 Tax=Bdellovibrio sp. KM01 TaxID=2748865 RepID=UPI0015E99E2C|nr:hypothetical protein [Bdellovibrio sp. KM01]QLY25916.1 hypothetical protein HW988_02430 [Bdellovibrio sp. KM01]